MEGLWTVEFRTNTGSLGGGVVILQGGRLSGGDAGYYYMGTYSLDDGKFQTVLQIKRYRVGHISVFGPAESLQLTLSGKIDGSSMDVSGQVAGIQISVRGTKRESF